MKLRYYLRGLGIGVIVTALLMGVALKGNQPLSDAEIRVRAMELGMVDGDSRTLTDIRDSRESGSLSSDMSDPAGTPGGVSDPTPTVPAGTPTPTVEPTPTGTPAPTVEPTPTTSHDQVKPIPMVTLKPTPEQQDSVTFVIHAGQSSYAVSKALAEEGLVEDASGFDQYLEANGYSKRISTGTYEIPVNATQEEIAKIITRSR